MWRSKWKLFDVFGTELRPLTSAWLDSDWEKGCSTCLVLEVQLSSAQQDCGIANEDSTQAEDPKNLIYETNPIVNKFGFGFFFFCLGK